jgi:hypothetical protein
MKQHLEPFTEWLQPQGLSTIRSGSTTTPVTRFSAWLREEVGEDVPPVEVTTFDVQSYHVHLIDQGRKPAIVNSGNGAW